jgi:hypothetical protein
MSKATEEDLGGLHGEIARGLTTVIRDGETIGLAEDGVTPLKRTASAAFFMAGITFLKNNNITASASKNEALTDLQAAMAAKRLRRKQTVSGIEDAVQQAQDKLDHMMGVNADGLMQ